ncbi:MAG: FAD-binding oxidoreductase [Anaerolineae bacterium]|nr:MAG: FAD-binding oxidoreductase [Anaerolineae bacterium]
MAPKHKAAKKSAGKPSALAQALDALRPAYTGRILTSDHTDYETTRTVFLGDVDRRPAVILRPAGTADVARGIALARDTGLPLAIRSGGHSGAGHSTTDGGIVLDLRDMKALDIDVSNRTAWAETGLTAAEVTGALSEHGLAIGFGDTGTVGIGGITLGGGVGFLVRKHGLTIDNLLAAEVVPADGSILHVDAANHPDLFWALRGGGGNFGVVTRFQYRLHELPSIVGGFLFLPATPETVARIMAAAAAAPEELSTIANVMSAPPMPFLPEELHGSIILMAMMVYAGDAEAGEKALAPFRALGTPLADMLRPMAYAEMFPPEEGEYRPLAVSHTMFIEKVDGDDAATMLKFLNESDAPLRAVQLRALGGAYARVPADATAYAHRDARIMVNVAAFYEGPADRPAKAAWVKDLAAALHQGDDRAYVNFINDEGAARTRAAYPPAHWERLAAIKAEYDPDNLFRLNQNVPPEKL